MIKIQKYFPIPSFFIHNQLYLESLKCVVCMSKTKKCTLSKIHSAPNIPILTSPIPPLEISASNLESTNF